MTGIKSPARAILTHRSTGARSRNEADLRHHTGGLDVRVEHIRVASERVNALLNASTTTVVDANDRHPELRRFLHYFDDLLCVCFRKRPTKHSEVLAEQKHHAAVDFTVACDDAVSRK